MTVTYIGTSNFKQLEKNETEDSIVEVKHSRITMLTKIIERGSP